jgi:hypothetical protein
MSQDFHGPASHASDQPTVHEEKAQRIYHRDAIAAIFKRQPLEELDSSAFKHVTEHYQQRISNCRTELGMKIPYTKRWITREDGSKQRIEGTWRYQPYEQLGPSSDQYRHTKLLF